MIEIKPGIYRHFKYEQRYLVLGIFSHTETLEKYVAYACFSGFWVRPLNSFLSELEIQGKSTPRFLFEKSVAAEEITQALLGSCNFFEDNLMNNLMDRSNDDESIRQMNFASQEIAIAYQKLQEVKEHFEKSYSYFLEAQKTPNSLDLNTIENSYSQLNGGINQLEKGFEDPLIQKMLDSPINKN